MSVAYWGDIFYGINRIEQSHLFDEDKEREIIIKALEEIWDEDDVEEAKEDYELNFGCIGEIESDNGVDDLIGFLGQDVQAYYADACNKEIMFFGVNYCLPWEVKEIVSKKQIDTRIYYALKPILKDGVTFEEFEPLLKRIVFNGADDYITYYEY